MRMCNANDCDLAAKVKGFCGKHYARFKRRGSPYIVLTNYDKPPKYKSLQDYIEKSFKKESNGCWEWQRSITKENYGNAWWEGKHHKAHRLSWTLYNKEIPKGLSVLHKCDNRKCINPSHLFLGTCGDNNRDRKNKGRNGDTNGQKNPFSKLKEKEVKEILSRIDIGEKGVNLAKEYKVSISTISKIKKGINWSFLKDKREQDDE